MESLDPTQERTTEPRYTHEVIRDCKLHDSEGNEYSSVITYWYTQGKAKSILVSCGCKVKKFYSDFDIDVMAAIRLNHYPTVEIIGDIEIV